MWASPDKIGQVDYALATGALLMDWYQAEMDMEYHLPKMGNYHNRCHIKTCLDKCQRIIKYSSLRPCSIDQVAVPDYPSGATEHWGIVTYRETRLLFDPTQAGTGDKNSMTSTISHELSHMVINTFYI